jgi:large subunit ribosomal protein L9
MDVILLQDVDNLGRLGDVVTVRSGYARNFLIPQGLAALASESQKRILAEEVQQEKLRDQKAKRQAESMADQYRELSCTITVQAGEDDKLFGSVPERDIAAALKEQDIEVEFKQVELAEPIKQLGVYSVPVKLHPEVEITVKVWVVKA